MRNDFLVPPCHASQRITRTFIIYKSHFDGRLLEQAGIEMDGYSCDYAISVISAQSRMHVTRQHGERLNRNHLTALSTPPTRAFNAKNKNREERGWIAEQEKRSAPHTIPTAHRDGRRRFSKRGLILRVRARACACLRVRASCHTTERISSPVRARPRWH